MSSYHYSFYSPHGLHCLLSVFSHGFHCLLRIFSHRFHRFTQKLGCLQGGALVSARLCRLPEQEVHQPSKKCTKQNRYSPTESTEPTELLAECILPQIAQIDTEVRLPSRGCTCLRSALPLARARSAPTKQEVHQLSKIDILPRNPQNPQNCLLSVFSHRLHRFTQKLGCLQGGALVSSAPTKQYRYTSCYVGALETSAPPEVSRFCEFCVFCGRHFAVAEAGDLRYYLPHPNHLCRSVKSVGESSHPNHLCQSVKSVGEHPPAEGSVNSAYSVGDP